MGKNSAFARVMSLTRSFGGRDFDEGEGALAADGAAAPAEGNATGFPVTRVVQSLATEPVIENILPSGLPPLRALPPVGAPPADPLALLTADLDAALSLAAMPPAPGGAALPAVIEERSVVSTDALSVLEADIASILATLERSDRDAATDGEDVRWHAMDAGDAGGEPVTALLGELNRLWANDRPLAGH